MVLFDVEHVSIVLNKNTPMPYLKQVAFFITWPCTLTHVIQQLYIYNHTTRKRIDSNSVRANIVHIHYPSLPNSVCANQISPRICCTHFRNIKYKRISRTEPNEYNKYTSGLTLMNVKFCIDLFTKVYFDVCTYRRLLRKCRIYCSLVISNHSIWLQLIFYSYNILEIWNKRQFQLL